MKPSEKLPQLSAYKAQAELCRRNFYDFLVEFWDTIIPDPFIDNWHIRYLCDELQKVARRVFDRQPKEYDLIINIPPGTSKSTICTIMFPVWCWTNDPKIRVIGGSYSGDLATSHAVKGRDIINSDKFKLYYPNIKLKADSNNKTDYENNSGGQRVATSVGGTITGKHAHILIVDDPIKPSDAQSEAERTTVNKWVGETLSTRKVDKELTPTILIMQRVHYEDPTGFIMKKHKAEPDRKPVKHICLPAELSKDVNPPELKDKYIDELLDPKRLSKKVLLESRSDLGSYGYSGQMQQTPTPEGGGTLKSIWFSITKELPNVKSDLFIDGAFTEKTTNDPTAIMEALPYNSDIYIVQSIAKYLELYELLKYIKDFTRASKRWRGNSVVYIEEKASGLAIKSLLKKDGFNVIAVDSKFVAQGKIARASAAQPVIEAGRVKLLEGHWNESFLNEVDSFPNGATDDQVDNLTAAVNQYAIKPEKRYISRAN